MSDSIANEFKSDNTGQYERNACQPCDSRRLAKRRIPNTTVPIAPMPVHTAYAVPTGRLLMAMPNRLMLAIMAASVPIVGQSFGESLSVF